MKGTGEMDGTLALGLIAAAVLLYAIYLVFRFRRGDYSVSWNRHLSIIVLTLLVVCAVLVAYIIYAQADFQKGLVASGVFLGGASLVLLTLKFAGSPVKRTCVDVRERNKLDELLMRAKKDWEETFDIINDAITIHDREFRVVRANKAALNYLDCTFEEIIGEKCFKMFHGLESPPNECPGCCAIKEETPIVSEIFEPSFNKYTEIKALPRIGEDGTVHGVVHVLRDITERKLLEREREDLIGRLEIALAKIKTLKGLIPMCAWCKKVRDDHGYWKKVEEYIEKHSDATFTHGICPECIRKEEESYAKTTGITLERKVPSQTQEKEPKDIKVMFDDDSIEMVSSSQLQKLICMDLVKQFQRSDGWVSIGTDPIRGIGGTYGGPERRRAHMKA